MLLLIQAIDCGECSEFDTAKRARAPDLLTLIASYSRDCKFSKGQCLTFVDEEEILYFCWVYAKNPFYEDLLNLPLKRDYRVKGWVKSPKSNTKVDDGHCQLELTELPILIDID